MVDDVYHFKNITLKKSLLLITLLKMGVRGSTSFSNHSLAFSHDFYFCPLFTLELTIHSYPECLLTYAPSLLLTLVSLIYISCSLKPGGLISTGHSGA